MSNGDQEIIVKIDEISRLEDIVRDHINTTRYQSALLQDLDNWNQICCALDTIGDTLYSIRDYIEGEFPETIGLKYIHTYGLLQALFIQQDATRHLSEAFEIDFELTDALEEIRLLRNASIGHPTKHKAKGTISYNYISRMTMTKLGFTLMRCNRHGDEFIDVDIYHLIEEQLNEIAVKYKSIADTLKEVDRMHKEKFKDEALSDIFHPTMGYLFSKVGEGIWALDVNNVQFGLAMLQSIRSTYQKFEEALRERGDIEDHIEHDLKQYMHAIDKLETYLSGQDSNLTESDARIYLYYIREEHKHFVTIAQEIDTEYQTGVKL